MKNSVFHGYRIFVFSLLLCFGAMNQASAQIEVQAFVGKAHSDRNRLPALRYGVGLNNVLWNRVGFYYTYELRRPEMPFENGTYTDSYTRDVLGGTIKIDPNFSVYGGLGMFQQGFTQDFKFKGIRKEVGVQYSTNNVLYNTNMFVQVGYSFSMRFTTNFGVKIPLTYEKRTLSEVIYAY
jgi:hypothetical protein